MKEVATLHAIGERAFISLAPEWRLGMCGRPALCGQVRLFFVVAREAAIGGRSETCPSVGLWAAHVDNVSCNRLSFLMRLLSGPSPVLRVRRPGCLWRPSNAGLARTRSKSLRMSRGSTVPTQCPHSAHTVPTQCPLEFCGVLALGIESSY